MACDLLRYEMLKTLRMLPWHPERSICEHSYSTQIPHPYGMDFSQSSRQLPLLHPGNARVFAEVYWTLPPAGQNSKQIMYLIPRNKRLATKVVTQSRGAVCLGNI